MNLRMAGSAAAAEGSPTGFKALVCLFLNGGNDSFNMLAPKGPEYASYSNIRQSIAIPEASLLTINPLNTGTRTFGIHPALPALKTYFDQGKLAFAANVGTLVEHVTTPVGCLDFVADLVSKG